jgi:hypothetical protein
MKHRHDHFSAGQLARWIRRNPRQALQEGYAVDPAVAHAIRREDQLARGGSRSERKFHFRQARKAAHKATAAWKRFAEAWLSWATSVPPATSARS